MMKIVKKEKIVVLNSGGFDSVCLIHYVREQHPDAQILSLFFDYGQTALEEERECSYNSSEKVGAMHKEIQLDFDWVKSSLTNNANDKLYVEMRNLIFLSYALSYAESNKADKIYVAFIEPQGYPDTSFEFLDAFNATSMLIGVEVIAPFHDLPKEELARYARVYEIGREDFCSCFHTEVSEEDKCPNCIVMDDIYSVFIDPFKLDDLFLKGEFKKMQELIQGTKIDVAKLYINDICNLQCPYCLVDNVSKFNTLSIEEWHKVIDRLFLFNISSIDFGGKEPLVDDTMFHIIRYCEETYPKFFNYSFISNGKNLMNYKNEICDVFEDFTVSYDITGGRQYNVPLEDLKYFIDKGITVQISLDIHSKNINLIPPVLQSFHELGVDTVFMKPIVSFSEMDNSEFEVADFRLLELLTAMGETTHKPFIVLSLPPQKRRLANYLLKNVLDDFGMYSPTIRVSGDNYCLAGKNEVFIASDGAVSGCGYASFSLDKNRPNILEITSVEKLKEKICTKGQNMCSTPIE